ncbi:TetR family transcriptional regulator [Nocardioides sp. OK12]|uniref:TetR/AcrR family transcriptional regulator n=1 Tax=Nocardioides TaxID=1839 RepID=UPI0021C4173C|nr:TetR/AcrR family transcriptional regulator [Nocardioides sp. OK12]GHJ57605.1 TetR family transcriptional regulator [Nocardioides sp. OK12]
MPRREQLLDEVTDHVLEHGLIGLTLRPVAAAIGTSDRMLIYHFENRDALVSAVVQRVNERAVAAVEALPSRRTVRAGVHGLWEAFSTPPLQALITSYVQAAATGLLGEEPYRSDVQASNAEWAAALRDYFVRCGAPPRRARRVVRLVDASLVGLHVDLATETSDQLAGVVDDLARAAQGLAHPEHGA